MPEFMKSIISDIYIYYTLKLNISNRIWENFDQNAFFTVLFTLRLPQRLMVGRGKTENIVPTAGIGLERHSGTGYS